MTEFKMKGISNNEILIYGDLNGIDEFVPIALQNGFSVPAIHTKNRFNFHTSPFKNALVNKQEFVNIATSSNLPITIVGVPHRHDRFNKCINYIRNTLKLNNHILHPVFLCNYYKSPHQRYHLRGFPGSGNMVFQNILDHITKSSNFNVKFCPDSLHNLMVRYAFSYWCSLTRNLDNLFDKSNIISTITSPKYIKTASYAITLKGKDPGLPQFDGLPCHAYVWSNPWGGDHSPLTTESIDFFQEQNLINIQLLRHPLDILISNAHKAVCTSTYSLDSILKNDAWFQEMLNQITKYCSLIFENKSGAIIIKYEDVMNSPTKTIQQLSTSLGSTLPNEECLKIWENIDGVKLSSYWKPGKDKWKKYLTTQHKEMIEMSGLITIAKNLGYDIDLNELQKSTDQNTNVISKTDAYLIAVRDALDHRSNVGKKITHHHPNLITQYIDDTNVHVNCTKEDFDKINSLIKSNSFKDILKASSLHPSPYSSDAYHYFHKK